MKKTNNIALAYSQDFLSFLLEDFEFTDEIKEIILFGSSAKETYDKESDIDLFFDIKNKEKTEEIETSVRKRIKSFEVKAGKTWNLKNISFPISFIVGDLDNEKWIDLKDEIASSGIVLYGRYQNQPNRLNQKYLIYYSLANLSRNNKMKFIRILSGYSTKKQKKEYKQKGLLEEKAGKKLGSNVILINRENLLSIKKILLDFKIGYKILEVWIRE